MRQKRSATGMTHAQYARYRRCSKPYITKLLQSGVIHTNPHGRIDPEKADAAICAHRDPARAAENGAVLGPLGEGSERDATSFAEARRRKEIALATLREYEVRTRGGELIEVEAVRQELSEILVYMRTMLLGLPGQIGGAIDDPRVRTRVVALADRRIREALQKLARFKPGVGSEDVEKEELPSVNGGAHA